MITRILSRLEKADTRLPAKLPKWWGGYNREWIEDAWKSNEKWRNALAKQLRSKLLAIVPYSVIGFPSIPSPFIKKVITNGHRMAAVGRVIMHGKKHECHANTARQWKRTRGKIRIATGFALEESSGAWTEHSWGIDTTKKNTIVETTFPFRNYFGIVLDEVQSALFHKREATNFKEKLSDLDAQIRKT